MKRLHFIADSLNIQYKSCVKKDWTAFDQTMGYYSWESDTSMITKLILAFKKGESRVFIEDKILNRPKKLSKDTSLVIRCNYYDDYAKTFKTEIALLGKNNIIDSPIEFEYKKDTIWNASDGGFWIFRKENWYDAKMILHFYYIINPFQKYHIPGYYNDLINYSQCMVDTNTDVYAENAQSFYWGSNCKSDTLTFQKEFLKRISSINFSIEEPIRPKRYRGKNKDSLKLYQRKQALYNTKSLEWQKKKELYIYKQLHKKKDFNELALNAWKEAIDYDCFEDEFIDGLDKYYDKKLAFQLKRLRYPKGICGYDGRPRTYLIELAILAANVGRWDVFLRAHLNMMNDYARRNSDNSMAARNRGVYIRELDQLPINLDKMFIGMLFRINNAPKFHYYNTLTRSATAMALSRYQMKFKSLLYTVLSDRSVDTYNRVVFAYTYLNFLERLELKEEKLKYEKAKLLNGISDLPAFLRNRFIVVEEN